MSTPHESDLWSPQHRANPFPLYARLRREAPVSRLVEPSRGVPLWLVTRYKDAVEVLRHTRLVKDPRTLSEEARSRYFRMEELSPLNQHMLSADPPRHTRLRSLVAKVFTPRRVEELRPRIEAICQQLLDTAQPHGGVDLLDAYAFPLPITVIGELLGVPLEDQHRFREWTGALMNPRGPGGMEAQRNAGMQFITYFQELIARRRGEPRNDLLSDLMAVEEQGDRLNPTELLAMLFLLLLAGHETTVNLIGNGVWALLKHPEQLARLRADPALIDSAVEEMLRYASPVETSTSRFAVEDMELFGQRIPAGELVSASLLSANHDPEQFPEPERFDITREPNRHIAFGFGSHFCLGASLARLEATIAINALLARLPRLCFASDPDTFQWRETALIRGLKQLPVAF
jgi:cytochrome P450 PksS